MDQPSLDPALDRRVLIATTTHFTLVTQRAATIAEATGRAGMFLTASSMVMVALGFIAGATDLGPGFFLIAVVLLLGLLILGLMTFLRVVQTGVEDMALATRIGRIEDFYASVTDGETDWRPTGGSASPQKARAVVIAALPGQLQILLTSASMVAAVNAALVGAITALILYDRAGAAALPAAGLGLVTWLGAFAAQVMLQSRMWADCVDGSSGGAV